MSLMAAELDPAWRDDPDLKVRDMATSLFAAGVGSSAEMMTSVIDELSEWLPKHPEGEDRLGDLRFVSAVVQESLRLHPAPPGTGRVALEDVRLSSGELIERGQWVAVLLIEANRDRSVFGADADEFNPDRTLPTGVPRYGLSFGSGPHMCLGLPIVLGREGVGSHVHAMRLLLAAGVQRDPDRAPVREQSERTRWESYPVIFTRLGAALAALEQSP
jgi:cytochrome P450